MIMDQLIHTAEGILAILAFIGVSYAVNTSDHPFLVAVRVMFGG